MAGEVRDERGEGGWLKVEMAGRPTDLQRVGHD